MENLKKNPKLMIIIAIAVVVVIVAVIGIVVFASGKSGNSQSTGNTKNEIALDTTNYSQYLNVDVTRKVSGNSKIKGKSIYYPAFTSSVTITGASSNYNFNDVEVVVELSGKYTKYYEETLLGGKVQWTWKDVDFDKTMTVKCNIGGAGTESYTEQCNYVSANNSLNDITYNIVSVKGTVTPVR